MSTSNNGPVLASLDIGSSLVKLVYSVVGAPPRHDSHNMMKHQETPIDVVGVGLAPNTGTRHGVVVNIEATTESIRKAKEEAELMSGYSTNEVWVSVSGTHIQSFDSKGMVAIKNKEVTQHDVERVIEAAKAIMVPADRMVLHVIPREYKIDSQDGISDPIGMSGIRLEASVHIVTASQSAISNLTKCIEKAGFKVMGIVLDHLAASKAVLSEDEKNLGVCTVDIGGGSSKIVYFVNGSVAHTAVIPVGGSHFTNDISVGLRTPQYAAEELKKKYGSALASLVSDEDSVEVEGVGGRKSRTIPRKELAHIIEARAEECLGMIANNIRQSGLQPVLGSGIVVTGGTSSLDGIIEMGEFIFDIPVRRGFPRQVGGLKDVVKGGEFATSIGLLMHGLEQKREYYARARKESGAMFSGGNTNGSLDGFSSKLKKFFNDLF
ncbi:cell division protein FtsA [Pseudobdellovibrio exovorus]|uniref:Cell division protein FtsA n=1 Tax=Pseudobdellovibrio exovorus JSS TaxID=1184267 RepID=M4VSN6_9BACT|nr:cell division protein FtsA [Pseudobdellovibrio exovorus]AGH96224.1 cell division protein FtsA [Pseudobdellovibrio exovorus JSS]